MMIFRRRIKNPHTIFVDVVVCGETLQFKMHTEKKKRNGHMQNIENQKPYSVFRSSNIVNCNYFQ